MKSLYLNDIKDYVKARLDELSNNDDALLVSSNQAVEDLDKEIERAVVPSVRKIHLDAPNVLLKDGFSLEKCPCYKEKAEREGDLIVEPQTLFFPWQGGEQNVIVRSEDAWDIYTDGATNNSIDVQNDYVYIVELPRDFLRLITLRLTGWTRPIQTLVGEDSAEYRMQQNRFLRGTAERPVGALVHTVGGLYIAELYTSPMNAATIRYGQYVPEPILSNSNGDKCVMICEPLEYPCKNQIVAEVLRGIGRSQEALMYDRMAVQPFRIDPEWARLNPLDGERFNTQQ